MIGTLKLLGHKDALLKVVNFTMGRWVLLLLTYTIFQHPQKGPEDFRYFQSGQTNPSGLNVSSS